MNFSPTLNRTASRRGFLKGMAGILAAGVAPAFIGSKVLMPVKPLVIPEQSLWVYGDTQLEVGQWQGIRFIITNTGSGTYLARPDTIISPGESKIIKAEWTVESAES